MRIFVFLFFTLNTLIGQKVVKKSIVDNAITSFQINASNCFEIRIDTSDTDEVILEATIDGEYKNDLVLNVNEEGTSVLISTGFRSNFENPNDKLSAHKVVSIALEIKIPQNKQVRVFGTNCYIHASGVYENLKITLNDGISTVNNVEGMMQITSQSGDIIVASAGAQILATSKYGTVAENQIPNGDTKYVLNTVTGNISLKRIE